jgi:hypothetical protein
MRDLFDFLGFIVGGAIVIAVSVGLLWGVPLWAWGDRNVADLNVNAPAYLKSLGFDVRGREGFTYGLLSQPGGCVWYTMTRPEQPTTIYTGCVARWHNGTYELWGPKAINAVSAH